ncbi:MAG: dTDP-4-dehydrorhamnose 3,5-epimerase [Acidobacteria bacterium]|nr:MAG: dTDP-4-dehydrorhamnose 3,5-epimerase [Acidobacteriota bacterium]
MKTTLVPTPLAGLVVVETAPVPDDRGFFVEIWNRRDFAAAGIDVDFVQDNHSRSAARVLRGLHYQDRSAPLAKLVRCTRGSIFDVGVDIRAGSPTFGKWFGIELSAENMRQFFLPAGFAHGFLTLSDVAEVQYKQTGYYVRAAEGNIAWNDPEICIAWPIGDPVLSPRDREAMSFREYRARPAFP